MTAKRKVAVLTVTYNDAENLEEYFEALDRLQDESLEYEVCIVDSGSQDASAQRLKAPGCRWPCSAQLLTENVGFAAGMNRALTMVSANTSYLFLLNADARPAPDAALCLVDAMERYQSDDRRVAAATGRLVRPSIDNAPARLDACGMQLVPSWRHLDRGSGQTDRGQFSQPALVFGATGAASMFRREALEDAAIDGELFDPRFHSFREDAELCFRLQERGWCIVYEPRSVVTHHRFNLPERRRDMPRDVNYHSLKNRYLLRCYHQTASNLLSTLGPTTLREVLILLYVLSRERSSLRAYRWLWQHRAELWERRRAIQARRRRPPKEVNAWFWRSELPLAKPDANWSTMSIASPISSGPLAILSWSVSPS